MTKKDMLCHKQPYVPQAPPQAPPLGVEAAPSSQSSHWRERREDEAVLYHSHTVTILYYRWMMASLISQLTHETESFSTKCGFHHSTCIYNAHRYVQSCIIIRISLSGYPRSYARIHRDVTVLRMCVCPRSLPHKCVQCRCR